VDAFNRLLASVFRITLERCIGDCLTSYQKGFLRDRQMLKNVIDIDSAAHKISLKNKNGAIILFDFSSAFSALGHDMIWDMLEVGGIDPSFISVLRSFYHQNKHLLKVCGQVYDGVEVHSGVRQGCPLSGLIFALCVDVLLITLAEGIDSDEALGAFADDIGLVVKSVWNKLPTLQMHFDQFHRISGLALNVKKTVLIPLWSVSSMSHVRLLLREACPSWHSVSIQSSGKYLGFFIGPGAVGKEWQKPLAKFKQRVLHWASLRLGMPMNILAYNIYIAPVLEYVAQLVEPSAEVLDAVSWSLRRLAPGPGNWATQTDLENLSKYGFRVEFRTIQCSAIAAKARIVRDILPTNHHASDDLVLSYLESDHRAFGMWFQHCYSYVLARNTRLLSDKGLSLHCSLTEVKQAFQVYNAEPRLRQKIHRWKLASPPAHTARRILANINEIGALCRPCVVGAAFRTLWNGWPTSARMRSMPGISVCGCVFGCEDSDDRIEHYLLCSKVWKFLLRPFPNGLGFTAGQRNLQYMLFGDRGMTLEAKLCVAHALYAIMRTVHTARQHPKALKADVIMKLHVAEGLRGSRARGILKKCFQP